jgi:hypothetical protein
MKTIPCKEVIMARPLIIEYTNLLHKYRDPAAAPVKEFLQKHSSDKVLLQRAQALNKVFRLKQELVVPRSQ